MIFNQGEIWFDLQEYIYIYIYIHIYIYIYILQKTFSRSYEKFKNILLFVDYIIFGF